VGASAALPPSESSSARQKEKSHDSVAFLFVLFTLLCSFFTFL